MKIIGHRGAAGLALENTIASVKAAIDAGVDAVEIDVQRTKDGVIVVFHDATLWRLARSRAVITRTTYADIQKIPLKDGSTVPTLAEVIEAADQTPLIIEIKQSGIAADVLQVLENYPDIHVMFTSFSHGDLRYIRRHRPDAVLYMAEHFSAFDIVVHARKLGCRGININGRLLNPLTYRLCKRNKLQILAYTINSRFIAWFFRRFYPDIILITDRPDRLIG